MSAYAEAVIVGHLCDTDALRHLVTEGLDPEMMNDEALREVVEWALRYYHASNMVAPSLTLLTEQWGTVLEDAEVDIATEPEDSVEWALEQVRSSWVYATAAEWQKDFAVGMADAKPHERTERLAEGASKLLRLSMATDSSRVRSDFREAMLGRIAAYHERAGIDGIDGMGFGLEQLDTYTHGIRPGELAVVAAGPKTGKSFWACLVALAEWRRGRVTALFTLENSPGMTLDRIACLHARVDPRLWDVGQCTAEQVERVTEAQQEIAASDTPLWVVQPDLGRRSFDAMVAEARILEADSVIVDQLTFVEMPDPRKSRTERIGDALHRLKGIISTGRKPLPLMLMHQVNREGVKLADKTGWLEMHHMAESAEVERTADWVFGMYASDDDRTALRLRWQTLASRRAPTKNWELTWALNLPAVSVRHEVSR
jgi:hypothetical protein